MINQAEPLSEKGDVAFGTTLVEYQRLLQSTLDDRLRAVADGLPEDEQREQFT